MTLLQAYRPDQVGQPLAEARPGQAGQPGQRPADQVPDGVAAVQRRIRVLEHDLQRLELLPWPVLRLGAQRGPVQFHDGAFVRCDEAEQGPGQGGLAAA